MACVSWSRMVSPGKKVQYGAGNLGRLLQPWKMTHARQYQKLGTRDSLSDLLAQLQSHKRIGVSMENQGGCPDLTELNPYIMVGLGRHLTHRAGPCATILPVGL